MFEIRGERKVMGWAWKEKCNVDDVEVGVLKTDAGKLGWRCWSDGVLGINLQTEKSAWW